MTETIGLQAVFDTSQFTSGLKVYVQGVGQATGVTKQAEQGAVSAGGVLQTAMGTAFGFLAAQAIPAAIGAITGFVKSGWDAATSMQGLQIGIETLVSKELIQTGAAKNMNDALAQSTPIADALLSKIEELSIISPFTYEDVTSVFRLNMAFGQSADTSLSLTEAILNMAAGMNLSGDTMTRVTRNFGQMAALGKITQEDINSLAEAGIRVSDVFKTQLNMSVEQVNSALKSGKLTMADVSQAFVTYADTYFAGAAERMSKTAKGIGSSFSDLFFFSAQDIFGPVVSQITTDLNGLFNAVSGIRESGNLDIIGVAINELYSAIKNLPGAAMEAGSSLVQALFGPISSAASDAYSWGMSMIDNYAQGIIDGAANALIAAMNYISELLAYWMSPGSPPLIAPELDQWGAGAMDSYLQGFSEADFSSLKSLQGPMQDVFGLFEKSGALGKGGADAMFAQFSEGFSAMLASGKKDQSFFDNLAASAGSFGDELSSLASANFDLAMATDAVAQAEKDQQSALQKSSDLTKEYNDLLTQGASQDVLDAKLAEINAQELAAKAAGDNLAANKEQISTLQDQIGLQEQALGQLTDLAGKSLPEAAKAAGGDIGGTGLDAKSGIKKPSKAGGGAGGAGGLAGAMAGGFDKILADAKAKAGQSATDIKNELIGKLGGIFAPIKARWDKDFAPVFTKLFDRFNQFVAQLRQAWDTFSGRFMAAMQPAIAWWNANWPKVQAVAVDAINTIKVAWDAMILAIQPAIDSLMATLKDMGIDWDTVAAGAKILAQVIGVTLAAAITLATILIVSFMGFVSGLAQGFADFAKEIQSGLQMITQGFKEIGSGNIKGIITGLGKLVEGVVKLIFGAPLKFAGGFLKGMSRFFGKLIDGFMGAKKQVNKQTTDMVKEIEKKLIGGLLDAIKSAQLIVKAFSEVGKKLVDAIVGGISSAGAKISKAMDGVKKSIVQGMLDAIKAAQTIVKGFLDVGKVIIDNIVSGIKSAANRVITEMTNTINSVVNAVKAKIAEFIAQGVAIINNIITGIKNTVAALIAQITTVLTNVVNTVKTKVLEFVAQGVAIINNIISGISQRVGALTSQISSAISSAVTAARNYLSQFLQTGIAIMQNIIDGIAQRVSGIVAQIQLAMNSAVNAVTQKVSDFIQAGRSIIEGIMDGVAQRAGQLLTSIESLAQQIYQAIKDILGIASPSRIMIGVGWDIDKGLEQGIQQMAMRPVLAAQRMAGQTARAATMSTSSYTTYHSLNNTVNMGGVVVNNGMDAAMLDAHIRQVLRSEFTR